MQLGTRWSVGVEPPVLLAEEIRDAIASVERELHATDTSAWRWTLTWLEGRPMVELDDGTSIRARRNGTVSVERPEPRGSRA